MIRSLARVQFIDRKWTAEILDAIAVFWLHLCRMAEGRQPENWKPEHVLELRLSGFSQGRGRAIQDLLTHRYSAPGLRVRSLNPDVLIISWESSTAGETLPRGLGLSLFKSEAFNGLIVEIRLAGASHEGVLESTTTAGHTLVLLGQLNNGELLVKSLWGGLAPRSETAIYDAPTPWEAELLSGFDRFQMVPVGPGARSTARKSPNASGVAIGIQPSLK